MSALGEERLDGDGRAPTALGADERHEDQSKRNYQTQPHRALGRFGLRLEARAAVARVPACGRRGTAAGRDLP